MTEKLKVADLPDFDMAEMLKTEEDVANYLTIVLEENDMGEFTHALGVVARARGMSAVAEKSGLTREALYKALRPSSKPRFDTIYRVCNALGVRLVAQAGSSRVSVLGRQDRITNSLPSEPPQGRSIRAGTSRSRPA